MRCYFLLLILPPTLAFQLPFNVPFFSSRVVNVIPFEEPTITKTQRIAIIGAGAGGSSAAFWISRAKERFGVDVEIDVYEREAYIGGRSTIVYPYGNNSFPPLELGASIFVKANKNLWRASDEFNLTRQDFGQGDATGIWDGERFLFSFGEGWWDGIKIVWRYGLLSPKRTDSIVASMIEKFVTLYASETPKWDNITDLASSMGWSNLIRDTAADYFTAAGISKKFIYEIVEAATRVNYGQNVDKIHSLEGLASLATSGATGIQGGNFQLFDNFLKRSGANTRLNTTVISVSEASSPSHRWKVESTLGSISYKAIILAAPFHSTNIALPPALSAQIPEQEYVHLHVTLLTTTSPAPNPAYFSQAANVKPPTVILTTYEGVRNGGVEPEFNSLSYHGRVRDGEWAVKIFSKERISDEWLDKIFFGKVGWVFRKEWDAYPRLPPTSTFPPVRLGPGFYYVNSFEPFISTMETETIAARNVVDLLLNEDFGSSICGPQVLTVENDIRPGALSNETEFVYGWDC